MITVFLGLGSALGYVLHDLLMMRVVRVVPVWTAMCWSMGVGMLIIVPLSLALYGLPNGAVEWRAVEFAAASGLCEAAALGCLLRGLVTGNLSIVAPLSSLAGGFVALIAVAGGEPLTTPALLGLPLAVAGGILASIGQTPSPQVLGSEGEPAAETAERDPPDRDDFVDGSVEGASAVLRDAVAPSSRSARPRGTAGTGWALLSSGLFAVVILLLDQATALPSVSIAAWGRVGAMAVLIPVALVLSGLRLPRWHLRRCGVAGVADAAGYILFAAAIIVGPLAVASVVIAQGGTMAVLLGYLALRERLSRVQYVGVACTCAACTLFALS